MTTKLKLRDDVPRNVQALIRRIVLGDPEMQARDISAILEGAGIQLSLASVSVAATDMRVTLRLLKDENLLIERFERKRLAVDSDFIETRSTPAQSARPRRDGSRGRT